MIDLYFHPTPNPAKVALMLEETGLEYELHPVDTKKGEQHLETFLKVNPNRNDPAALDRRFAGMKAALEDAVRDHSAL
ncbi:hypothetical protein [Trinickia violacea]|uniref:hypothetical protein n=1 Tax=Trinickia violacea TaxID=2571746 RepID=UPI0026BC4467